MSFYQYSQLFCIVETLVFCFALIHTGNAKVRSTHWLKWAKRAVAFVMFIVGAGTAVQFMLNMSVTYPRCDNALNLSMLYLSTFVFSLAFLPLVSSVHLTPTRVFTTFLLFLFCMVLVWISVLLDSVWYNIVVVASISLYFIELVRIVFVFFYNYKHLGAHDEDPGSERTARDASIRLVARCIMLLFSFAVLYLFMAIWVDGAKAFHNLAMLSVWAYLFVAFVNLIINYHPALEVNFPGLPLHQEDEATPPHPQLASKLDRWVADGAYCRQGVTMIILADQLGTNRTYLSQLINNRYGCNFNAWLTSLRVERAKELLCSSPTLSLDKIAVELGFSSKSHFMRAFKSLVGMTPGQWRQQHVPQ